MKKTYCLCDLRDLIELAKYIQEQVSCGGYFLCKDTEESHLWKDFWNCLDSIRKKEFIRFVIIYDTDRMIEFA